MKAKAKERRLRDHGAGFSEKLQHGLAFLAPSRSGGSWQSAVSSCLLLQSLRLGVIGAAGSGKTALLLEWMRTVSARNARIIIYDPMNRLDGLRVDTWGAAVKAAARPCSRTSIADPELYANLLALCCERGCCTLIIDEAQDVFPRHCPSERLRAIQQGRNKGVGILWASQRPTRCDTDLSGNSQGMIIGTLLGPADMSIARGWGVDKPLQQHVFRVVLPSYTGDIVSKPIVRGPSNT